MLDKPSGTEIVSKADNKLRRLIIYKNRFAEWHDTRKYIFDFLGIQLRNLHQYYR